MKTFFVITFISFFSIKANSQCDDITFKNRTYPEICVYNAIKWMNMSTSDWHKEMKRYDFSNSGTCDGAPCYYSGTELNGTGVLYSIIKDFGMITIINAPLINKTNIFEKIIGEIEPYYSHKDGNVNFFQFEYTDGQIYLFGLAQNEGMDTIFLMKKK